MSGPVARLDAVFRHPFVTAILGALLALGATLWLDQRAEDRAERQAMQARFETALLQAERVRITATGLAVAIADYSKPAGVLDAVAGPWAEARAAAQTWTAAYPGHRTALQRWYIRRSDPALAPWPARLGHLLRIAPRAAIGADEIENPFTDHLDRAVSRVGSCADAAARRLDETLGNVDAARYVLDGCFREDGNRTPENFIELAQAADRCAGAMWITVSRLFVGPRPEMPDRDVLARSCARGAMP